LVSGQIRKIEEIDLYQFRVSTDGPVTVELIARRIGSPLHGMLTIRDSAGNQLVDVADTEGRDLRETFFARAAEHYTIELHDLDYAGDRSYVYRLQLTPGPQVLAAYPAAGQRGASQTIQFVGIGI